MTMAPSGPTDPLAGVIAANPAIDPVTIPNALGLPTFLHSHTIQPNAPVAAEIWVTRMAIAASGLAPNALPPLNPNHPTQSMPVPVIVIGKL